MDMGISKGSSLTYPVQGRNPVHRLLNTLLIRQNEEKQGPELAVEDGGLHTVESIPARYFMFLDVYFHKTRRIFDYHLVEFLSQILDAGAYPNDLNAYLEWFNCRWKCRGQSTVFSGTKRHVCSIP